MKDLLLITPPFTQLNTPYPATAYLKGFLNTKGILSCQVDLGIEVILELFTKNTLSVFFEYAQDMGTIQSDNSIRINSWRDSYLHTIEDVVTFLQGQNPSLARQICSDNFLPQASRFDTLDDLSWAFGTMGMQDKAKHLATLYLEDLSDFIVECVDDNFGFSRYGERLGRSANDFNALYAALQEDLSFIDQLTVNLLDLKMETNQPKLVCLSIPFPGNLYSAFRCAQFIKANYPGVKIAAGGGFPNTELRSVSDPRVFDFFDYITLDDGELPIELIWNSLNNKENEPLLKRTFLLKNGSVEYNNQSKSADYKQREVGTPDYSDLFLSEYISVIEVANPMHSLWSDGRWNKLTMAHGCYWGKCTFCDISLDYIQLYEPIAASLLVDRMEEIIEQTGDKGFHFVDEAAPPALMKALALEILKRKITVTWWTNIRFEKNFTSDLCQLLKASGCIAVSGGLEVASDRLLDLIDKGVSVAQVAQVTKHFTDANIMVHSYLMYGYPSQTVQETIDSLEMVRQMFELGILQSGFWHQFALTAHSPIGLNPEQYGIEPNYKSISFANNDIEFVDRNGIDHNKFSQGLRQSLFNFMHGVGFDLPLHQWFEFKIPKTTIGPDFINTCLQANPLESIKPNGKIAWLGGLPLNKGTNKKGKLKLQFFNKQGTFEIAVPQKQGEWLFEILPGLQPGDNKLPTVNEIKNNFESEMENFELFWYSKPMQLLKDNGLLVL